MLIYYLWLDTTQRRIEVWKHSSLCLRQILTEKINQGVKEFGRIKVFFGGKRGDSNIGKLTFPENTLFYINQEYLSAVKEENVVYKIIFFLGQNIPALNVPVDIESHVCAEDEVKLIRLPLYNLSTGEFKVIAKTLAYVNACVKKKNMKYI